MRQLTFVSSVRRDVRDSNATLFFDDAKHEILSVFYLLFKASALTDVRATTSNNFISHEPASVSVWHTARIVSKRLHGSSEF